MHLHVLDVAKVSAPAAVPVSISTVTSNDFYTDSVSKRDLMFEDTVQLS